MPKHVAIFFHRESCEKSMAYFHYLMQLSVGMYTAFKLKLKEKWDKRFTIKNGCLQNTVS